MTHAKKHTEDSKIKNPCPVLLLYSGPWPMQEERKIRVLEESKTVRSDVGTGRSSSENVTTDLFGNMYH